MLEKESMTKRIQRVEQERSSLDQQLKQALANIKNVEQEMLHLRKQIVEKQLQLEIAVREKNILARNKETSDEQIKRLNHEMMVCEYSKRKIEQELDSTLADVMDVERQLDMMEKERDKYNTVSKNLAQKVSVRVYRFLKTGFRNWFFFGIHLWISKIGF